MKTFLDFGQDISEDFDLFYSSLDPTMFHIHPHYELMITLEPLKVENIIAGKRFIIDYPCAILVSQFTPHFANILDRQGFYRRYVFYFGTSVVNSMRQSFDVDEMLGGRSARVFNLSDCYEQVGKLVQAYMYLVQNTDKQKIIELIFSILRQSEKTYKSDFVANQKETYIINVIEYITHNLNEKCTTQEIADVFFVSQDKLRKDFKKYIYVNIGEFIQKMKLNKAKGLFENRKITVADVATECGFESESYFYKLFRRETGKTPQEYRKVNFKY